MPEAHITLETPIATTPRVKQVCGLFDLAAQPTSRVEWHVALPLGARSWNVGLIVGPSGCGKSTVARHLFEAAFAGQSRLDEWPEDRAILDAFPESMAIKDIVALLSSVGFSSPPAWLRPFRVLSTGQQFRVRLARLLASCPDLAVMDEFTSVVDRTVAQVGSAALARTVRQCGQKFVAVTCHEDVEAWLQPDWVYRPGENVFQWRCLQRRPAITLTIFRCRPAAWRLFHQHHYLSGVLSKSAVCFLATWQDRPVAFSAWINALTKKGGKREHRTVVLPDYQGAGLGMALSGFCAGLWKGLGQRATSTTTHPAFVAARLRSQDWRMVRRPSLAGARGERRSRVRHAATRLTAGFEYVGPALDEPTARRLLAGR
jgi:ABC-type lipoprotein export system ATPase subunit